MTDPQDYNEQVWRPDVLGSALFLVSSLIARFNLDPDHGSLPSLLNAINPVAEAAPAHLDRTLVTADAAPAAPAAR